MRKKFYQHILIVLTVLLILVGCTKRQFIPTNQQAVILSQENVTEYNVVKITPVSLMSPCIKLRLENKFYKSVTYNKEYRYVRSFNKLGWILSVGISSGLIGSSFYSRNKGFVLFGDYLLYSGLITFPTSYLLVNKKDKPEMRIEDPKKIPLNNQPVPNQIVNLRIKNTKNLEYDRYVTNEMGEFEIDVLRYYLLQKKPNPNIDLEFEIQIPDHDSHIQPIKILINELKKLEAYQLGNRIENITPPYSNPILTIAPFEGYVLAGDFIDLIVTIKNSGKGPYNQLMANIISSASWLSNYNFYFGNIEPDVTKSDTIRTKVPKNYPGVEIPFQIKFQENNSFFPETISDIIFLEEIAKPKFQIKYHQIVDDGSGYSVGNADGIIQQGEMIDVPIEIMNTGRENARNVKLEISSPYKLGLNLSTTERNFSFIEKGTHEQTIITFSVTKKYNQSNIIIDIKITEKEYGIIQKFQLNLPIVKDLIVTESIALIEPDTTKIIIEPSQPPLPNKQFPPVVNVLKDGDQVPDTISTSEESLVLQISVWDDYGIDSLIIFTDNKSKFYYSKHIIQEKAKKYHDGQISFNTQKKFKFSEGIHKLSFIAYDSHQKSDPQIVYVRREKEQPVDIWVVAIGISNYKDEEIADLKYSHNDAKRIVDYYKDTFSLPNDHYYLLQNENATLTRIKRHLGEVIPQNAKKEDLVIIYFAGHGDEEQLARKDKIQVTKYILPYNAKPNNLYSTALKMDEIADMLERIQAERMLFIGDYCYSGGIVKGARSTNKKKNIDIVEPLSENFDLQAEGRFILTSSRVDEVSVESDSLEGGVLTHFLLKALKGEDNVDINRDKNITIYETFNYIENKVKVSTQYSQHPQLKSSGGNIIIGRILKSEK